MEKIVSFRTIVLLSLLLIVSGEGHAEQLPVRTYTTADGLPSTFIAHIMRDSRGSLWFSTRDGLSRFDGYRFVNYNMQHGLPHTTINYVLETRQGVYWVATNGAGMCRFNPDAGDEQGVGRRSLFTVYPVGDEPRTNRVDTLYENRAGQLWAGTAGGLFRFEVSNGVGSFRRIELKPSSSSTGVVEDRAGSLWIGTARGLVRRLPDGRMIHYALGPSQGSENDTVRAMLLDREGRLWIGDDDGLLRLNPERVSDSSGDIWQKSGDARRYTTADGLAGHLVTALHQSSDGRIWIGTRNGLTEFDGERFHSYTTAHGLTDNWITVLAEDRAGNLWLGTQFNGAMRLTRKGFTTYNTADGLGGARIHSIFEDQAGALQIVSGDWFINRFDGERFTAVQPALPPGATHNWNPQAGFLDRTGQWWMLFRGGGLHRLPKARRIEQLARARPAPAFTSRDGLSSNRVFRIFEDSRGLLWIGMGFPGGLATWERATETLHLYSVADGLPSLKLYSPSLKTAPATGGSVFMTAGWRAVVRHTERSLAARAGA